jgi:ribosomal protein L10
MTTGATGAAGPTYSPTNFLQTILNDFKADELPLVLPLLGNFFNGLAGNLSAVNALAQLTTLEASLVSAQSKVGSEITTQLGGIIQAEAASLLAVTGGATGASP